MIPHSRPTIGEEEADAAGTAICSGRLVDGPLTEQFEQALARQAGASWGVAVSSGTSALHLALLGLDIGPGDRVAIPSYVCVALLQAVRYTGAEPVVVDVDPMTMNIDPDALKRLAPARLKAVIVPHLFGLPADIDAIVAVGVPVIEDCAHAIGALYKNQPVGGQGILSIYSFYATKMLTTGEGGMVVGRDTGLETRIRALRDYDCPDASRLRFNYKLTEMQAAMGLVQLRRLPDFLMRRHTLASVYRQAWKDLPVSHPVERTDRISSYYRYTLGVAAPGGISALIEQFEREGIACRRPVTRPIHQLYGSFSCPGADAVFDRTLSVPFYPSLTESESVTVLRATQQILGACG